MARLTDREAYQYSEQHVCYELDMLRWSTLSLLNTPNNLKENSILLVKNSLVETFAIHSRNLIDFLFPPLNTQETDVTIRDYLDQRGSQQIQECQGILKEARYKANKQVAHLTINRITFEEEGKEWSFLKIYNAIINQFLHYNPYFVTSRVSPLLIERFVKIFIQTE